MAGLHFHPMGWLHLEPSGGYESGGFSANFQLVRFKEEKEDKEKLNLVTH